MSDTSSPKHGELSQLIGETIISYRLENSKTLRIACESGRVFHMTLEDEGGGGNDSCASFQNVILIKDYKVTAVREEERSSHGARFAVECKWKCGVIEVVHDSNGYYDWDYEVTEVTPATP